MMIIEDNHPPMVSEQAVAYCKGFLMTVDDALPCACTFARAFLVTIYGNNLF